MKKHARDNFQVHEIWNWYRRQIVWATNPEISNKYWAYGSYDNGVTIEKQHRQLYRADRSLQSRFANPFASGPGSYYELLQRRGYAPLRRIGSQTL